MLGKEYHRELSDTRISYEIINDPSRISLIRTWKYNRPPDMKRVIEVEDYIKEKNMVDGQILLAIVNGECVCYDGSHRLEAAKRTFPKGGVQVRIIYDSTNDEVKDEFYRINKSIPVPDLYFSDDEISVKLTTNIQNVTRGLCENYKSFISTSRRPQRPNFNRDTFTEELSDILKNELQSEQIMNTTEDTIAKWLQIINQRVRENHFTKKDRIKCSSKILAKCEKQKFYLFAGDWKTGLKKFLSEL